jgi:polyisoprenoid-binding protein YceI
MISTGKQWRGSTFRPERFAPATGCAAPHDVQIYVAVTIDDDPGKDLRALRQPGIAFSSGRTKRTAERATSMTERYRVQLGMSRFTVQAFASGMLSFLGHSPTFAVTNFDGVFAFENGDVASIRMNLTIQAASLRVADGVKDSDRTEIEERMRQEVLELSSFPEVQFESTSAAISPIAKGQFRARIDGKLVLHGVTRPHAIEGELLIFNDGLRLRGESSLHMSEHGIKPVSALAGTIKLKDELKLQFDIAAMPEAP